ncbi:nucleolar protein dao-5 isoform X2 [Cajanus cajan]|uniref:nucleolar protein dao-5 isoform X2 n=1 Tax=Cajanus cajan TaxID=3821 RepID=UPI00098D77DB|nr:nucleolar protein dao-5 isoform X2 [Cajanus cajan]
MSFRQRTPTFRPQLSMRRVYENLQPRSEIKELPGAYLLHIYLPGFPKENVKVTYVAPSRMVRISGERQILGSRWIRFDQSYPVPDYCEPEALQAKFETPVLILTMPKKTTSQDEGVVPKAKPDEKGKETTPPQPTTTTKVEEPIEDKKSASPPSPDLKAQQKATLEDTPPQIPSEPIKPQKGQGEAVERLSSAVSGKPQMNQELEPKPTPRATTMQTNEKPQKGQEEFEPRPTPTILTKVKTAEKPQKGQEEFEPRATPTPTMLTKVKTAEKPQMGQEEFEPRPTPTMLTKVKTAEKTQEGPGEFEQKSTPTIAPKTETDEQPPKSQVEDEPKPTVTNVTRKPSVKDQVEEKKTEETSSDDEEEVKEEPSESRKPVKDKEQSDFEEKETKTEKLLAKEVEPSATKKKKEKEPSSITTPKKEGKCQENAKEWVGSVSQVVRKIAEETWNEEEKKLAANIGAAFLVIAALGAYVSYRFSS